MFYDNIKNFDEINIDQLDEPCSFINDEFNWKSPHAFEADIMAGQDYPLSTQLLYEKCKRWKDLDFEVNLSSTNPTKYPIEKDEQSWLNDLDFYDFGLHTEKFINVKLSDSIPILCWDAKAKNKDVLKNLTEIKEKDDQSSYLNEPRWSKTDDIQMFKVINRLIITSNVSMSDLKKKNGALPLDLRQLLFTIKDQSEWKNSIYELRKRIAKVLNTSAFTARDIRRAKSLIKSFEKGLIKEKELLENFPGKTLQQILKFQKN